MTKMGKVVATVLLGMPAFPTIASADVNRGEMIYMKKLKAACGFNGAQFAMRHTQDEWEKIKGAGKFEEEVQKICPGAKLKDKDVNDVYDFAHEYASDSENVPSW